MSEQQRQGEQPHSPTRAGGDTEWCVNDHAGDPDDAVDAFLDEALRG